MHYCVRAAGLAQVQCTAINHIHKRVVKFDLLLPENGDPAVAAAGGADATFVPVANKALLPANLRDAARFHASQLPVLLQRLLKALYATSSNGAPAQSATIGVAAVVEKKADGASARAPASPV